MTNDCMAAVRAPNTRKNLRIKSAIETAPRHHLQSLLEEVENLKLEEDISGEGYLWRSISSDDSPLPLT